MSDFTPTESMLNNYIQNKLSDKETEQVEIWLADHPEVVDDLEIGVMFKQAEFDPETIQEKASSKKANWLTSLFQKPVFIFSHAAMIAIGMFLFNTIISDTGTNSVATFIELEKQRGLDTSIIEIQTNKSQSLVLRFFPDSMTEKYSLIIQSKNINQRFEYNDLIADDYGSIVVALSLAKKMKRNWDILLINNTSNVSEQQYLIKLN